MMNDPQIWLGQLTLWDALALGYLALVLWATGLSVTRHPRGWLSTGEMVSAYRLLWMRRAARREVRVTDITLLALLRTGATFLASMTMFAIGGAVALLGQIDLLESLAQNVVGGFNAPRATQQVKLLCLIALLVYALLKFIWSVRVFGYCAVLMSAVPNDPTDPQARPRTAQAAELNIRAAMNFNRGLRAMYFALGALAWLLGAVPLVVATTVVIWVVWSREFASIPRDILLKDD